MIQLRTVALDIELDAAKVELRTRKMALAELEQSLPGEIESAEAAVQEVKARLVYSRENYERLNELSKDNGVSRQELEEASSQFRSQEQMLINSQALLERLQLTRDEKIAQAKLSVEAQDAEIRRLEEQKFEYTIRAPFPGFVTAKKTELGQWVKRGDEVMDIIQLDPIELVVPVPQTYIQQLQVSMDLAREKQENVRAIVTIESVSELLEGEVIQIVPEANLLSRSFPVKIRMNNPRTGNGHLLKSGMLATARMFVGPAENLLMVKKDALVLGGPQKSLFVVRKDPQTNQDVVMPVPVQIGGAIGDLIQVSGAVEPGELVVIEGNERLRPAQSVQVIKEVEVSSLGDGSLP
jgi:HlyD family secretion protein